jgi:omega-hydroxy-beta-dihydromenaquinone-9 sulfotransferase
MPSERQQENKHLKRMSTEADTTKSKPINRYPSYSPRFWHGMRCGCWWRLLARNGFRIAPSRLYIAAGVSVFTPFNDLMALIQWFLFGAKIQRTKIQEDPIFILGHWRSGTTLLHELMVADTRYASPSTYQCFAPWHFLISEWGFVHFGNFLIPQKRPMDEMDAGWLLPQEDEFALMNLGLPTPYLSIAFPQEPPPNLEFLDMENIERKKLEKWRLTLHWFVRALTVRNPGKRLVLKSPPHTGRLAELLKLFPNAKFIHLTRDPRKLFYSTMRLWRSLDEVQGLQLPRSESALREYVWTGLTKMYKAYEAQRSLVPAGQLIELRYEDLVADPLQSLRDIYDQLKLGEFDSMREKLAARLANHGNYQANQHVIDEATEREIFERWHDYAQQYGYLQTQSGTT